VEESPARRTATRGGCSPLTRTSPSAPLTRTARPNVRASFPLIPTYTSVAPRGADAPHATATVPPSAAIDAFAFARPGTPRDTPPDAPESATRAASTRYALPALLCLHLLVLVVHA